MRSHDNMVYLLLQLRAQMEGKLKKSKFINFLNRILFIRDDLPKELEEEFEEYKDIRSIDRIEIAAWIGFILTILLFLLDYKRHVDGEPDLQKQMLFLYLFYSHLIGLLFIILALYIYFRKKWIIQTQPRRGVVIWSMVVLAIIFVMSQTILSWKVRHSLAMYMAFIFMAGWMFSMSHKERMVFTVGTLSIMIYFILSELGLRTDEKIAYLYEVVFLSIIAFYFDSFDYNMKVSNFLAIRRLEEDQVRITKLEEFKSRFFTNMTHELRTP